MTPSSRAQVWIGEVEVLSPPDAAVLGRGWRGGFALMMAWATGPGDFRAKIKTHCSHLSLELIRISGAKPFAGDRHNNGLDANLISAAGGVAKKMNAWHGTFHSYSKKMKSTKVSKHAGKPR